MNSAVVPTPRRARWRASLFAALPFVGAAIPAICIGSLVARYGVDVPSMDDWEMVPLIAKAHAGQLTFADIFAQQEEARTVFPKLIVILTALGRHWDMRHQMMLSLAFGALTMIGVYVLLTRSGLTRWSLAICSCIAALLIFSPAQFDLWTFASGFPSFMPAACIVGGLVLVGSNVSTGLKFFGCALLSLISTFTLAHGLLAWALTFPVLFMSQSVKCWRRYLLAWAGMAIGCLVIYFYDYSKPVHLPQFAPAVSPLAYLQFFCAFVGGTFASASRTDPLAVASLAGAVWLLVFALTGSYLIAQWRDEVGTRQPWPWLALGLYSLGSDAPAMLGRIGYGVDWATSSRYVTFSLYLILATVVLVALAADRLLHAGHSPKVSRVAIAALSITVLAIFGTLFGLSSANAIFFMQARWAENRLARSAILFSRVLDTSSLIKKFNYPYPPNVIARTAQLAQLDLLRPRLIQSGKIAALFHRDPAGRAAVGWCDAVVQIDAEHGRASGWAALLEKGRPADAVVLAFEISDEDWQVFAISDAVVTRADVVRQLGTKEQLWSGWFATFPRAAVPASAKISAWAFDAESAKLYRLKQNSPELTL